MKRVWPLLLLFVLFPLKAKERLNIAINGFGRIGKTFLRIVMNDPVARERLNIAVINTGSSDFEMAAHLFRYDTLMGTYKGEVRLVNDAVLAIDGHHIPLIAQRDVSKIDWHAYAIDWVVEATGHYTERSLAQKHLEAGAKNVLITAPAQGEDLTFVLGVNDHLFDPQEHRIVSPGSCTSNALAPIVKVINDQFGIEHAFFSTVHAFTGSQALLDSNRRDPRRSRSAPLNIVPTSTGAAKVISKVIPEMRNIMSGYALRVPIGKVSIIDLMFVAKKPMTIQKIKDALHDAAAHTMHGVLHVTDEPLVSSDFAGVDYSVVVDGLLIEAMGNTGRITGWYDNEWGYSARLKDFLVKHATL